MFQEKDSFLKCRADYPSFANCKVVSVSVPLNTGLWKKCPSFLRATLQYRVWKRTFRGPADSHFLQYYSVLKTILRQQSPDLILLENTSCLNAVSVIRRYSPKSKIVLNAHNVDSDLAEENYKQGFISKEDWKRILRLESNLGYLIDAYITCSAKDLERLQKLNRKTLPAAIIPNGVEIKRQSDLKVKKGKRFLFCGSLDYHPNQEGVQWFLTHCWSKIKMVEPDAYLDIIGSGNSGSLKDLVLNYRDVTLHGRVPSVAPWYQDTDVVIVPLLHGSGTRLKVLEAMSFSKPIVSTSKGAEGIEYENNKHLIIADDGNAFSDACCMLLKQSALADEMALNARNLVVNLYNWDVIGDQLSEFVVSLK